MKVSNILQNLIFVIILILFFPIIIGGFLNHPVGLTYVESESMYPLLDVNDGFFIIPSQLDGDYDIGDIIVFDAENFPYDFVTHRIVGETDMGYVTQGDNNTFPDQSGSFSEPYIKDEQIVGKALVINGTLLKIPKFGSFINFISSSLSRITIAFSSFFGLKNMNNNMGSIVISLGLLAIIAFFSDTISAMLKKGSERVKATRKRPKRTYIYYVFFVLFLLLISTISIISLEQDNLIDFVATEGNTSSRAVHLGDSVSYDIEIGNTGLIPIYAFVEGKEGILEVDDSSHTIGRNESVSVDYKINAPDEPGYYREYIGVDIYLGLLPYSLTKSLRGIHLLLPILLLDLIIVMLSIPIFILLKKELSSKVRVASRQKKTKNIL